MQGTSRPTVIVGNPGQQTLARTTLDAIQADRVIETFDDPQAATSWLGEREPHAILVRLNEQAAEEFIFGIRTISRLSRVPVIVLSTELSDLRFAQAYTWGADDVVRESDEDGLRRRLHWIPEDLKHSIPASRGRVVLAHAEQRSRVLYAWVLRNAGFDVEFATDAVGLTKSAAAPEPVLVVADAGLEADGTVGALRRTRETGEVRPWIILASPKDMASVGRQVSGEPRVAVHDAFAPPENLHFVANEMLSSRFAEQRASPRLLFGTMVAFRAAGRDRDRFGFSYNVSEQGIFVRTLDPLARGDEAWLEFTPPRTDRRVRLEGTVAWASTLGQAVGSVPPGFGVHLTEGSRSDLQRYRDGYVAFARDLAGRQTSIGPSRTGP